MNLDQFRNNDIPSKFRYTIPSIIFMSLVLGCIPARPASPIAPNPTKGVASPPINRVLTFTPSGTIQVSSETPVPFPVQGELLFTDLHGIYAFDFKKNALIPLSQDETRIYSNINRLESWIYFLRTTDKKMNPQIPTGGQYGPSEIFRMQLDGSGLEQLTSEDFIVLHLGGTPNGDYLSFSTDSEEPGNRYQVLLWDLRNHSKRIIAQSPTEPFSNPMWSPDGKRAVFFESTFPNDTANPLLFNLESGSLAELRFQGTVINTKVGWSPDGSQIALGMTTAKATGVYVYNVDNQAGHLATSTPQIPTNLVWSPNGEMIAFELHKRLAEDHVSMELILLDLRSGTISTIQEGGLNGKYFNYNAVWSPDGSNLAYITNAGSDHLMLNVYNLGVSKNMEFEIPGFYADTILWINAP